MMAVRIDRKGWILVLEVSALGVTKCHGGFGDGENGKGMTESWGIMDTQEG